MIDFKARSKLKGRLPVADMRTEKMRREYIEFMANNPCKECRLCKGDSVKEFNHWRIMDNRFPYDAVAKTTHILLTKRHVAHGELNADEQAEYELIKATYIQEEYHVIVETMIKRQSIAIHHHVNLLVFLD